ncbi:MAG TPA: hypothetical protein VNA12_03230 [Mycobacteriales bacterium]|nr:hypothetical protein [Mycobacteriales bacterium]
MTDPIQLLDMPLDVVDPPADFAAELRAQLLAELGAGSRRRRLTRAAVAAVAAAAAAVAGVIVLPGDDRNRAGLVVVAVTPTPSPERDGTVPSLGPVATSPAIAGVSSAAPGASGPAVGPAGSTRVRGTAPARPDRPPLRGSRLDVLTFDDVAHDGYAPYSVSDGNPRPDLSDPAVDIRAARFTSTGVRRFSVSLTLGAPPKADTTYWVAAYLPSGCLVYYYLTPGQQSRGSLFCGPDGLGFIPGSAVVVSGATLTARFDHSDADETPEPVYEAAELGPFFSRSCVTIASNDCRNENTYDEARSPRDARFRWR